MKVVKGELALGRFVIPYRIYGRSEKYIVCVSGAKQTMIAWRSFVSHFISGYSVVVFDLPGQGRASILSGSLGISFEEQVNILHSVIKVTVPAGTPIILAAASWGTIISAALAARYPDFIDHMILGSFSVKPSKAVTELILVGKGLFDDDKTGEIGSLMVENFGQYIPESHKKQIISQFQRMSKQDLISFYEHCKFVSQVTDIDDFVTLGDIKASTLIVYGEYDTIIDVSDVEDASTQIPDCAFKIVAGAGHFLHWEQPEILYLYSDFWLFRNLHGDNEVCFDK